jgi:anaerobic magnesium-protoporphyrin IX monomethyl ester cyclase
MRVLFILKQVDYEPQGILHLSSVLKGAGHDVRLCVVSQEDPMEVVEEFEPGIVGYSITTGSQRYYLELNRHIKERFDVFSVFGGPHPTFFPEMIEEQGVEGICIGEGEGAMLDLAAVLENGSLEPNIQNWWFKLNGEVVRNPVRSYLEDLDTLPFPDRELVYSQHRPTRNSKIKHFFSGRGCPYDCTYCFNHALFDIYKGLGRRVRKRSVDVVLAEISDVREKYPLAFVVFLDDTFIFRKDWMAEFAEKYPDHVGLPFFCNVRANLVTEQLVEQLRHAGCVSVGMGIEAGNDRIRNEVLQRNMSKEQIVRACELLRGSGINVMSTNMVGLPTGGLEDDLETLRLNILCRPAFANAFIFQPYPRTQLGELARREGLMEGTFDDISVSAWDSSVLRFPAGEKRQIENLQKLFAITVERPWLMPLVRRLVKLPRNRLFWLVHKLWKGYTIARRIHPVRLSPREYVESIRHFMKLE